jgi:peptidoglycan hydrolase-like protein with peptidoglycan-binding domain
VSVDLAAIQAGLNNRGYDAGVVDGIWGRKSQSALDAFRADEGIGRPGKPVAEDLAALRLREAPPMPNLDQPAQLQPDSDVAAAETVMTEGQSGRTLSSLPAVDSGRSFRIAWTGTPRPAYRLAIAPPGSGVDVAVKSWSLGEHSPTLVEAPATAGQYEIILIDYATNAVLVRRTIVVVP